MWKVIQETDADYSLYGEDGMAVLYGWPLEDIEYRLVMVERVDEYILQDTKGQEEVVRLR